MTITIPDPPDTVPIPITDELLTPAALDAIAGSWPAVAGGDPKVRHFKRITPLIPRTQTNRILVYDAVLKATVAGLPAPRVYFLDFEVSGALVELELLPDDRVGVDAWATLIGLPAATLTNNGEAYQAKVHATHEDDTWLGFSWVRVTCYMRTGAR